MNQTYKVNKFRSSSFGKADMTAERENKDLHRRLSHLHASDAGEASGAPNARDAPLGSHQEGHMGHMDLSG